MNGISVSGLTFSYGTRTALSDVSFDIGRGRFCALLGPNGAGKSTLFSILSGLRPTNTGHVTIAGHNIATHRRAALAQLGIVFQQPTLDLDLTVRQNLSYFAALHGIRGKERAKRIDAVLERLFITDRADDKTRSLNGGHRRRTEIARALLHNPKVLLLDEPTVGLDAQSRKAITDHVHDLTIDGTTVLWATHLPDEIWDADRLVVLHQSRVLADGTAGVIRGPRNLNDAFLSMVSP